MIAPGGRVHFIGIGGAGMSAIATVLLARGYVVSGCDLRESEVTQRLRRLGAHIDIGHDPSHLSRGQVVVTSRAVPEENAEIQAALARGMPLMHRAQMLAALMEGARGVAVVGTHGKTTTTSMAALILERAGRDPTVLIGGEVDELGGNARAGRGPDLIAEVDESDGSLLWIAPRVALVTPVEATDHLDFYGTESQLRDTFRMFLERLPEDGFAAICADAPLGRDLASAVRTRVVTYGLEEGEVTARIVEMRGSTTLFEAHRAGRLLGAIRLRVPGPYNVQNALGALALTVELGVPPELALSALGHFRGVKRRFTVHGEIGGVLVADDYAHNPTKVRTLLEGVRRCWPDRRIIAVFQPHRFTRTRTVGGQFAWAFDAADRVIITDLYAADEPPIPGVDAGLIVRAVAARREVEFVPDLAEVVARLRDEVRPGDLVLTIGAGDVWKVAEALAAHLRQGPARRGSSHA